MDHIRYENYKQKLNGELKRTNFIGSYIPLHLVQFDINFTQQ
jgi:hypothetical protein